MFGPAVTMETRRDTIAMRREKLWTSPIPFAQRGHHALEKFWQGMASSELSMLHKDACDHNAYSEEQLTKSFVRLLQEVAVESSLEGWKDVNTSKEVIPRKSRTKSVTPDRPKRKRIETRIEKNRRETKKRKMIQMQSRVNAQATTNLST